MWIYEMYTHNHVSVGSYPKMVPNPGLQQSAILCTRMLVFLMHHWQIHIRQSKCIQTCAIIPGVKYVSDMFFLSVNDVSNNTKHMFCKKKYNVLFPHAGYQFSKYFGGVCLTYGLSANLNYIEKY